MMKNTKSIILGICLIFLLPAFQGCKKYEEGPLISFRSKTKRITAIWKITEKTPVGCDSYCSGLTIEFTKDGMYLEKSNDLVVFEGIWKFNDKKTKIGIKYTGDLDFEYFEIVKLKEKEMWLKGEDGNDVLETHYEKQS